MHLNHLLICRCATALQAVRAGLHRRVALGLRLRLTLVLHHLWNQVGACFVVSPGWRAGGRAAFSSVQAAVLNMCCARAALDGAWPAYACAGLSGSGPVRASQVTACLTGSPVCHDPLYPPIPLLTWLPSCLHSASALAPGCRRRGGITLEDLAQHSLPFSNCNADLTAALRSFWPAGGGAASLLRTWPACGSPRGAACCRSTSRCCWTRPHRPPTPKPCCSSAGRWRLEMPPPRAAAAAAAVALAVTAAAMAAALAAQTNTACQTLCRKRLLRQL